MCGASGRVELRSIKGHARARVERTPFVGPGACRQTVHHSIRRGDDRRADNCHLILFPPLASWNWPAAILQDTELGQSVNTP